MNEQPRSRGETIMLWAQLGFILAILVGLTTFFLLKNPIYQNLMFGLLQSRGSDHRLPDFAPSRSFAVDPDFSFHTEEIEGIKVFTPIPLENLDRLPPADPKQISRVRMHSGSDFDRLQVTVVVFDLASDIAAADLQLLHRNFCNGYCIGIGASHFEEFEDQSYDSPVTIAFEVSRHGSIPYAKFSTTLFHSDERVWICTKFMKYGYNLDGAYEQISFSR